MKKSKKIILSIITVICLALILAFIFKSTFFKTDDWVYNEATQNIISELSYYIVFIVVVAIFLTYSVFLGIYNLQKGKKNNDEKRKKTGNFICKLNAFLVPILIITVLLAIVVDSNILLSNFIEIALDIFALASVILVLILILYSLIAGIKRKNASCIIFSVLDILSLISIFIFGQIFVTADSNISINGNHTYPQITNAGVMMDSATSTKSNISTSSFKESDSYIGYSTGGAKDANNFRENIKEGYFPISTDITYNGLFYDYSFDTSRDKVENTEDLFYPAYSCAKSKDPISNEEEYYLSVGLNSNIKESDFQRKKLNLTVVLDISGSMSSSFNSYYYDEIEMGKITKEDYKPKMQIANESVNLLLDQLNKDDRFAMVLFDDEAYLAKNFKLISETNIPAIKEHILDISARGGTNFSAGYQKATELYDTLKDVNKDEYENRIIVITDAMPNYGTTSKSGLMSLVQENADNGIYTSFVGVGVDFNTELINLIGSIKGANYYSVHNSEEFKTRLGEQFEYMVTPLVFDLNLNFDSDSFEIEKVYGTDNEDTTKGNIMKVNTLFPSPTSDGETKGGITVLKLKKKGNSNANNEINLSVSYTDRNGKKFSNTQKVDFSNSESDFYENTGIRKAIVLSRYVNVMKNWILYERTDSPKYVILPSTGIFDCDYTQQEIKIMLGENERRSTKLSVSEEYKKLFDQFKNYMQTEITELKDTSMNQEIEILDYLINYKN